MGIVNWVTKQPSRVANMGLSGAVRKNSQELSTFGLTKLDSIDSRGKNIYNREWDVLIILDGCRVDLIESVADEYDFLPSQVNQFRSLASCSRLWLDRNFTSRYVREMNETVYVTGNPYSEDHLQDSAFEQLDEVWRYGWDNSLGTVPARPMTDRAIKLYRERNPSRQIVHYMQPHFPSIPSPLGSQIDIQTFGEGWDSVWDEMVNGTIDKQTAWQSYKNNLQYVLDDVQLLLENIDADRVVVSADHGNAFGEWGIYGHPPRIPIDVLRNVPWVVTTSSDTGNYQPSTESRDTTMTSDVVESRLKNLGYM